MPFQPLWTPQEDAELTAVYLTKSNVALSVQFGRSEKAIKQRAYQLGIHAAVQVADDADAGMTTAVEINDAFIAAMAAAIRAGLERPPMVGVDTRHFGKEPRYVPHGDMAAAARWGAV